MAPISGYVIPIINQKPGYLHFNWHFYVKEVIDNFCLWHYVSETVPIPYLYKLTPLFIDFSKTNHSTFQLKARSFEWKVPFFRKISWKSIRFIFCGFSTKTHFSFVFTFKRFERFQDKTEKNFFKNGYSWPLFLYFHIFNRVDSKCSM